MSYIDFSHDILKWNNVEWFGDLSSRKLWFFQLHLMLPLEKDHSWSNCCLTTAGETQSNSQPVEKEETCWILVGHEICPFSLSERCWYSRTKGESHWGDCWFHLELISDPIMFPIASVRGNEKMWINYQTLDFLLQNEYYFSSGFNLISLGI